MTSPTAAHQQPAGWAQRAAILDDGAPHQIRLFTADGPRLVWSCTCTRERGNHRALGTADGLELHQILAAHRAHVAESALEVAG